MPIVLRERERGCPTTESCSTPPARLGRREQVILSLFLICTLARPLALLAISGYQCFISPHKGWCCAHAALHHGESCSAYAKRVIVERGVISGTTLLLDRLDACREAATILRAGGGPDNCDQACEKGCEDGCEKGCRQPCDTAWSNFWAELRKKAAEEGEKVSREAEKLPSVVKEAVKKPSAHEEPRPNADREDREQAGDLLRVKEGQFTFDWEGNDDPKSKWFSRVVHWPGTPNSGVTIGRGYDMGERTYAEAMEDLTAAGIPRETARAIAGGSCKKGADAERFCNDNRGKIGEITREQQKKLFEHVFPRYVTIATEGVNNARTVQIRMDDGRTIEVLAGTRRFDDLPVEARDVACDLAYQLGKQFKSENWGAIFQMSTFSLAADYLEGKLRGDVFDADGKKLPYRAENAVKSFRESRRERFKELVKKLRAADGDR